MENPTTATLPADNGSAGAAPQRPRPPRTPKPPKAPQPQPAPVAKEEGDEDMPLGAGAEIDDQVDVLASTSHALVHVTRDRAHDVPADEEEDYYVGHCGTVTAANLLDEVRRRWGGGVYRFTGRGKDGRVKTWTQTIPGASEPLADPPRHVPPPPPPGGYRRLPPTFPPTFPPSGPGGYYPQPPGYPGGGYPPPGGLPPWAGAFTPTAGRDLDELKARIGKLEAELSQERAAHQQTRESLVATKEQLRTEGVKREMEARLGEIQRAMAAAPKVDSMGEFMKLFATMTQEDSRRRAEALEREERRRSEENERNRQMLQSQMQTQMELLKVNKHDPTEMIRLAMELSRSLVGQQSSVSQMREMFELMGHAKEIVSPPEEDRPWYADLAVSAAEALQGGVGAALRGEQGAPQGAPAQQQTQQQQHAGALPPPPAPTGGEGVVYLKIVDQVIEYVRNSTPPTVAADQLRGWAAANGAMKEVSELATGTPAEIATLLEGASKDFKLRLAYPDQAEKLGHFAEFLKGEPGSAWAGAMLTALRQGSQT